MSRWSVLFCLFPLCLWQNLSAYLAEGGGVISFNRLTALDSVAISSVERFCWKKILKVKLGGKESNVSEHNSEG